MGTAASGGIRMVDEVMQMDIFTDKGLRLLAGFFGVGFLFGLLTGVVGFSMAIDVMAGR